MSKLKIKVSKDKIDYKIVIAGLVCLTILEAIALFKENKLNGIYMNFLVDDLEDFMKNFSKLVAGISITMPHNCASSRHHVISSAIINFFKSPLQYNKKPFRQICTG